MKTTSFRSRFPTRRRRTTGRRALGVVLACAALALVSATVSAEAAVPPPQLSGAERTAFIDRATSVGGLTADQATVAADDPAIRSGVVVDTETVASGGTQVGGATTAAIRCRNAWAYVDALNVTHSRLWRFRVDKYFCWNGTRVTSSQVSVSPTITTLGTTTGWDWVGVNSHFDRYYKLGASAYGGHHSYQQGRFKFCPPRAVCFQNRYPYVNIWGHHDGSWDYSAGW